MLINKNFTEILLINKNCTEILLINKIFILEIQHFVDQQNFGEIFVDQQNFGEIFVDQQNVHFSMLSLARGDRPPCGSARQIFGAPLNPKP